MTNELKTRRLIVTLPDTSGEEADTHASNIEGILHGEGQDDATVTHALGETLPDGLGCSRNRFGMIVIRDGASGRPIAVDPLEARQLAGVLLRLADEAEVDA